MSPHGFPPFATFSWSLGSLFIMADGVVDVACKASCSTAESEKSPLVQKKEEYGGDQ